MTGDFFTRFGEEIAVAIIVGVLLRKQTIDTSDGGWLYEREAPFAEAIKQAELRNGIPARLLASLLWQESRFRDDIIRGDTRSPVGAIGIAQFMPDTAREQLGSVEAALDPAAAIAGAGRYLKAIKGYLDSRGGNGWRDAVLAYNWGMGNVAKWIKAGRPIVGSSSLPGETLAYGSQVYDQIYG
jgi:soluble lytic murein transglycosylase-like protein